MSAERPPEGAERSNLMLFLDVQDVAHGSRRDQKSLAAVNVSAVSRGGRFSGVDHGRIWVSTEGYKGTTMSDHDQPVAANLLQQEFHGRAAESAVGRRHQRVAHRRHGKRCTWLSCWIYSRGSSSVGR